MDQIVSGGQTGVDRAALDVARFLEIPHGGWCPRFRLAEDGPIPEQYPLQETESPDYAVRTERNVVDSDGTLVLYSEKISGGTALTCQLAKKHRRPIKTVDLAKRTDPQDVRGWLKERSIRRLNVAGPRESTCPGIGRLAEQYLYQLFAAYDD